MSEKSIYGIILVIQGHLQDRKGIAKVKNKMAARYLRSTMIVQQMKPGTSVIPLFHVILSEKSFYGIILLIQAHFQGRKVISKVKM